jgi:hypothetical protein
MLIDRISYFVSELAAFVLPSQDSFEPLRRILATELLAYQPLVHASRTS